MQAALSRVAFFWQYTSKRGVDPAWTEPQQTRHMMTQEVGTSQSTKNPRLFLYYSWWFHSRIPPHKTIRPCPTAVLTAGSQEECI